MTDKPLPLSWLLRDVELSLLLGHAETSARRPVVVESTETLKLALMFPAADLLLDRASWRPPGMRDAAEALRESLGEDLPDDGFVWRGLSIVARGGGCTVRAMLSEGGRPRVDVSVDGDAVAGEAWEAVRQIAALAGRVLGARKG